LLAKLNARIGSTLAVGAHHVRVTRVLDYRPDQGSGFADLSATLLINLADVPATQLIQPGSRVSLAMLFAGEPGDVQDFREWLQQHKKPGERLQAIADASPQIRSSADRAGRFLSLASMVSVLLAAIAVAMAARALRPPASRQRCTDEMHGGVAALRLAADDHAAGLHCCGRVLARGRCWATLPRPASHGCCAISCAVTCPHRRPMPCGSDWSPRS
jgi:putative ABC transport system permease protein